MTRGSRKTTPSSRVGYGRIPLSRLAGLLPHAGLLVSGSNTVLFVINEQRRLEVLGGTIDDAGGEALDKGAKLLGLGYPGGPLVEKWAQDGDPVAFVFPRTLAGGGDMNFSFSRLKTSLLYRVRDMGPAESEHRRADLCASYQAAVMDVWSARPALPSSAVRFAASVFRAVPPTIGHCAKDWPPWRRNATREFLPALPQHTGDNAGMIAFAAWIDRASGVEGGWAGGLNRRSRWINSREHQPCPLR